MTDTNNNNNYDSRSDEQDPCKQTFSLQWLPVVSISGKQSLDALFLQCCSRHPAPAPAQQAFFPSFQPLDSTPKSQLSFLLSEWGSAF